MNIYTIAVPGQQPVDVQGVNIRTQNVSVEVPPSLPSYFRIYGTNWNGSSWVVQELGIMLSYTVPVIGYTYFGNFNGVPICTVSWSGTNQFGQVIGGYTAFSKPICGSGYFTPGNTTVNRCDVIVTVDSFGNEIRINGVNGQPCPTWTTRPVNDCGDTEIRCEDLSDPRGFCCIPCDSLNSKIRALI